MVSSEPAFQRYRNEDYVSAAMEFRCNLRCQHCMIEDAMQYLRPQSEVELRRILAHNAASRQWRGLILTGAEITLHHDLPRWAAQAREAGFSHVRIQTHGMRLAQRSYLNELVAAGVDEFFVSVAGADAATHDAITGVPGAFDKTLQGLMNLEEFDHVAAITNTVVSELNFRQLPDILATLAPVRRLTQVEFWCYLPMQDRDVRGLMPSHADVLPLLRTAIIDARRLDLGVEVKHFPECLLKDLRGALRNSQPQLFIDPAFWPEFARNGFFQCVYRNRCAATECLGLNSAYVAKYGTEADLLAPIARL